MPSILEPSPANIARAADILRAGGVVAIPTETVYGLGADTFNPVALDKVYELKGRPANNPLIAHVLDSAHVNDLVDPDAWTDRCQLLADTFWPGPLTLILRKHPGHPGRPGHPGVPPRTTANLPTIAVRSPSHPTARQLLEAFNSPISAPSANRSGHVSPTSAKHVAEDFAHIDDLVILDGGECEVGIESTVLDLSGSDPRVLRPGSVTAEQLQQVLHQHVESPTMTLQTSSPGTTLTHYAPDTPCEMVRSDVLHRHLEDLAAAGEAAVVLCFTAKYIAAPHKPIQMIRNAKHYASAIYKTLRQADALHMSRIVIEEPPRDNGLWNAVHDRLHRAASTV